MELNMTEETNSYREIYRTPREVIKMDAISCYGILDGKYFLVKRKTIHNIETYAYWHKNKNLLSTPLLGVTRADKLFQMILDRIPQTDDNKELIDDITVMRRKSVEKAEYYGIGKLKAGEQAIREAQQKKDREFKNYMDKQASHAQQNSDRKAQKEAQRQAQKAQKEAEKQKRQAEAQKRIQQQRNKKLLKEELRLYEKMLSAHEDKNPVIALKEDDITLFLGKMDNSWYRIKLSKESNSFYQITDQHRQIIPIEMFSNILTAIDEKLNKNGTFDHELENIALTYGQFMRENKKEKTPSTLNERVAISKNILIQKNILNQQNSL